SVAGTPTMAIAEGFATGASIHEATGLGVIVAFDAGNLLAVARGLRTRMTKTMFVFCADNDQWTKTPIDNPGMPRAVEAASAIGKPACVVAPRFKNLDDKPTDFNDLATGEGLDEVKAQILAAID